MEKREIIKGLQKAIMEQQVYIFQLKIKEKRLKKLLNRLWSQRQAELEARAVMHQRIKKTRELVDCLDSTKTWNSKQFVNSTH